MNTQTLCKIYKYKFLLPNFIKEKIAIKLGIYSELSNNNFNFVLKRIFENFIDIDTLKEFNSLPNNKKEFLIGKLIELNYSKAYELYCKYNINCENQDILKNYINLNEDYFIDKKYGKYNLMNILYKKNKINKYKYKYIFNSIKKNKKEDFMDYGKISLIMVFFNEENNILNSLKSIVNQSYKNIEFILIDDNSTDNSLEIVTKYLKSVPNINYKIYKNNKNYGAYVSKNIGISMSSGNFIGFQDADDYSLINRVRNSISELIFTKTLAITTDLIKIKNNMIIEKHIYPMQRMSNVSLIIRKRVIDEIGYFETSRFGNDSEYLERIKTYYGDNNVCRLKELQLLSYLKDNSLSNNEENGVFNGFNNNRLLHWEDFRKKHILNLYNLYVPFKLEEYDFKNLN